MVKQMEAVMDRIARPSKEAIRNWLRNRRASHEPLPDCDRIRRELGWMLVAKPRETRRV